MDKSNYISEQKNQTKTLVSKTKNKKQLSVAEKEKRNGIYAAFLFLIIMASITLFFLGDNILLNNISVSVFIISCLLLVRLSGPTLQK